jgi:Skp family chaperone for outer membrane proteins
VKRYAYITLIAVALVLATSSVAFGAATRIESFSQELEAQSDSLTDDEKAAKEEDLNKMLAEYEQAVAEADTEVQARAQELRNIMIADLAQVLQVLSAEEGYDLILDTSVTHFYSQLIDITWEVIRKYNYLLELQP